MPPGRRVDKKPSRARDFADPWVFLGILVSVWREVIGLPGSRKRCGFQSGLDGYRIKQRGIFGCFGWVSREVWVPQRVVLVLVRKRVWSVSGVPWEGWKMLKWEVQKNERSAGIDDFWGESNYVVRKNYICITYLTHAIALICSLLLLLYCYFVVLCKHHRCNLL